jgi:hypothetical protein
MIFLYQQYRFNIYTKKADQKNWRPGISVRKDALGLFFFVLKAGGDKWQGLSKTFKVNGNTVTALQDINHTVKHGELGLETVIRKGTGNRWMNI